jgi:uncharacterized protein (TIGR03086 family)
MDEMTLLADVLGKTADVVDGVKQSQWDDSTPCSEFTVKDLLAHMVGWGTSFEAAANDRKPDGDPTSYEVTENSAADFRAEVESITAGWRATGTDRTASLIGAGPLPAQMVLDMTMMEYLAHGWDLATATGQPMPYTDEEAQAVHDLAVKSLPDEYRGEGKPFGDVVHVPHDAPPLERFAGFMGRMP